MSRTHRCAAALATILVASLCGAAPSPARGSPEVALATVEGEVTALSELPGEGGLALVVVTLDREGEEEPLAVLLAPKESLEEIEFAVEVGDRLKVRIFADGGTPARAQRVLNLTRGSLVRLRTLHQTPLWSGSGAWQGGGARQRPGLGPGQRPGGGGPGPHGAGRGT